MTMMIMKEFKHKSSSKGRNIKEHKHVKIQCKTLIWMGCKLCKLLMLLLEVDLNVKLILPLMVEILHKINNRINL